MFPCLKRSCSVNDLADSQALYITCDELEDEMHVFLECQRYNVSRRKYLPSKLYEKPSMFKFIDFLQKADGKILSDLAIFCSKVLKDYDETQI